MAHSSGRLGSRRSRSGRLAIAQLILFFVGVVTVLVSAFGIRDAADEVIYLGDIVPAQTEMSAQLAEKELQDQIRHKLTSRIRIAYGVSVGVGALFIFSALLVHRMPVVATVTGLSLYLLTTAILAVVDPVLLTRGLFLRILIIIALIAAVIAALRTEGRRSSRRRRVAEEERG